MSSEEIDTKTRILEACWHLLEQRRGQGVSMSSIAKAAGISRQAVYLHYPSRTELMIATMAYVDEIKGLNQRLEQFNTAKTGLEQLDACVNVWCNYIPEIYGMAKAMLLARDSDEAITTAWDGGMQCLRDVCQQAIETLEREDQLKTEWSTKEAVDMFMTVISIHNWEQLTMECGWSNEQYLKRIKVLLRHTLVTVS